MQDTKGEWERHGIVREAMRCKLLQRCWAVVYFAVAVVGGLTGCQQAPSTTTAGPKKEARSGWEDFGDGRFEVIDDDPEKGLKVDGLLDATCLAEDKNGGLWIGLTYSGVVRFAGGELRLFNAYNAPIPDNGIRDILVDRDNVKWFCTTRGFLMSYDERRPLAQRWRTHTVSKAGVRHSLNFTCLRQDVGGVIWALCKHNGLMRLDNGQLKVEFATMGAHSLDFDADGQAWIATRDGVLHGCGETWRPLPKSLFGADRMPYVGSVHCDHSSGSVFLTTSLGVYRYHKGQAERWPTASHALMYDQVASVTGDGQGRFIVGYGSTVAGGLGASVFNGDTWWNFVPTLTQPLWLVDALVDSAGKPWLLSRNGCLYTTSGMRFVRAVRWLNRSRMERTLRHQTPWRVQSLEDLLKQPTVDATTDDIVNHPHKLYGKKIRIVGSIESSFEWADIRPADGTRIGTWPDSHWELGRFWEESSWRERLKQVELREYIGYLEYGGYFGHLGGGSRQLFIVEDYPHGDEAAKAELKRDLTAWIEQHRADSRIWPEPHTERRIADLRALQGKWDLVSRQLNGRFDDAPAATSWVFQWDRLTQETDLFRTGCQVAIAPERAVSVIALRQPHDAYGHTRRGIYELQSDQLRVKFSTGLDTIPTSWETPVDEHAEVLTFRRDPEYPVELDRARIAADPLDWRDALWSGNSAKSAKYDAFGRIAEIRFGLISGGDNRFGLAHDDDLPPLEALKHLTRLEVDSGFLTDAGLASISRLKSLEFLTVRSKRISDAGLGQLKSLRNLKTLRVVSANVSGEFLGELAELPNLVTLDLSRVRLNDKALRHLVSMRQLRYLILPATCTDQGLVHLSELNELRELTLLGVVSDTGLSNLRLDRKQQLCMLRIATGTGVSDRGLQALARLNNLKTLDLHGTSAGGAALASVSHCTRLRDLTIDPVDIDDDDLQPLGNLQSLFYLSLTGNAEVSAAGLEHLSSISTLWGLKIDGDRFDAACIPPLKKLPSLRFLTFTDHVPREQVLEELKSSLPDVEIR